MSASEEPWLLARVASRREWAEHLVTLRLEAPTPPFRAGQFLGLALDVEGKRVQRSYSMASAPGEPLEFFLARVEGGALTPRLFALRVGDALWASTRAAGHFHLERVPPGARDLWLLATGTGLGPFLSMLRTAEPWRRFERLVLVHGVRSAAHLAYREELAALSAAHGERLGGGERLTYVPALTREDAGGFALRGRLDALLAAGDLERAAGAAIDAATSHLLLCGNPGMIEAVRLRLEERGLRANRPRSPGQFTTEAYW